MGALQNAVIKDSDTVNSAPQLPLHVNKIDSLFKHMTYLVTFWHLHYLRIIAYTEAWIDKHWFARARYFSRSLPDWFGPFFVTHDHFWSHMLSQQKDYLVAYHQGCQMGALQNAFIKDSNKPNTTDLTTRQWVWQHFQTHDHFGYLMACTLSQNHCLNGRMV